MTSTRGCMDTKFLNNEICNTFFVKPVGIASGMDTK